jgi:hypothetical protein
VIRATSSARVKGAAPDWRILGANGRLNVDSSTYFAAQAARAACQYRVEPVKCAVLMRLGAEQRRELNFN